MGPGKHVEFSFYIGFQPRRSRIKKHHAASTNEEQTGDFGAMALLCHEAEIDVCSLEPNDPLRN